MSDVSPTIQIDGLNHKVGGFTLGPIDLSLHAGSINALVGPNGAGKTTLLDLMFGMGRVQNGSVRLAGLVHGVDEVRIKERIGFVSPDLTYANWGRVGGALDFLGGFYPDWSAQECERLLQLFELDRAKKIAGLSFGERTRLSLIIALARDTDALLLDEPTTGLDVAGRRKLFAELLTYIEAPGKAIVISSHQLGDLERLADYVAVLCKGKLLTHCAMDELVERFEQWDVSTQDLPADLDDGMYLLAENANRIRVMVESGSMAQSAFDPAKILARAPMTLEEIHLGLTGEAQ